MKESEREHWKIHVGPGRLTFIAEEAATHLRCLELPELELFIGAGFTARWKGLEASGRTPESALLALDSALVRLMAGALDAITEHNINALVLIRGGSEKEEKDAD